MQGAMIRSQRTKTVVISKALHQILCNHFNMPSFRPLVLHDAAPCGIKRMEAKEKVAARIDLAPGVDWSSYRLIAGYFGHLYSGRGIEIIEEISSRHPEILFLIFGGNKEQIEALQKKKVSVNFRIMGFLEPRIVLRAMGMMDILLMPYQRQVSIGSVKQDTALWMSPMKMFEYMATGVPIVASRLPVLNEVMCEGENCLMAEPDNPTEWSICMRRLSEDPVLCRNLANRAYQDYRERYNWLKRAQRMLELVQNSCG
jgi:glycosyltransferase involved in cell wall biosynthesis